MAGIGPKARWQIGGALALVALATGPLLVRQMRANTTGAALEEQLSAGRAYGDSLFSVLRDAPAHRIRTRDALGMLYLERLRLGLGSPFRIIDQALRDDELGGSRRRIAMAMLDRTLAGATYEVSPAALGLADPTESEQRTDKGRLHLALIDSVVRTARDPRVGELAVRLAYRLAAASGAVSRRGPEIATSVAAQVRDRVLAARDARELLEAAARTGGDPFVILREWREARRLTVERPVIVPLPPRAERTAVERLPSLVARLEALAPSPHEPAGSDSPDSTTAREARDARFTPVMGPALAQRVADVAEARDLPPQAPVTVTLTGYAPLIRRGGTPGPERGWRSRFLSRVRNEETIAAEYALLRARLPEGTAVASLAVLTAGVALRPYAQERAWLHGEDAPTARDLQTRYGISVSYDGSVRPAWRPYLRRSLASAVTDLRRVLPFYDPRGLRVHFGDSPLGSRALALHDPAKRTIYFPAGSSAGVMAHEFAHDLDWLAARRYYNGAGWYRTDRAARQGGDQLSGALRLMASASSSDSSRAPRGIPVRPTEVFARNVDWFVSAALAKDGRVNGYLSAVQDPVLTGYGSALTPEAAWEGGSATVRALAGMTLIPDGVRSWFTTLFGAERHASVHQLVRQVLEVPVSRVDVRPPSSAGLWAPDATNAMMRSMPVTSAAWACLLDSFAARSGDAPAARAVVQFAAEARARGVVRQWGTLARRYPAMRLWQLRALDGPPWDPRGVDDLTREVRDAILWRALSSPPDALGATLAGSAAAQLHAGCSPGR
jgi:hypothetical protein